MFRLAVKTKNTIIFTLRFNAFLEITIYIVLGWRNHTEENSMDSRNLKQIHSPTSPSSLSVLIKKDCDWTKI